MHRLAPPSSSHHFGGNSTTKNHWLQQENLKNLAHSRTSKLDHSLDDGYVVDRATEATRRGPAANERIGKSCASARRTNRHRALALDHEMETPLEFHKGL
jgi:hypothetical protein